MNQSIASERITYDVPGGKLSCLKFPNPGKPSLIGLHGFADVAETFQFIQPAISEFELYFPEVRGHGSSSKLTEGYYGYTLYMGDLIKMTGEIPKPYVLMGHSMGAAMAARFAGLYPEEIRGLILLEGFSGLIDMSDEVRRLRSFGDQLRKNRKEKIRLMKTIREAELILQNVHPKVTPDRITALAKVLTKEVDGGFMWRQDPGVKTGGVPMPVAPVFSRELWKRVTAPVLFIYGSESDLLPGKRPGSSGSLDEILGHFQNIESHCIEGAGHNIHHEQPEQIMELITQFLNKLPALNTK